MTYISTKITKDFYISEIITIHYFEYTNNFVFHGETHDFWEMLFVEKGTIEVQAENDYFQLADGDIIFHKPNEFHAFRSTGNTSLNLVAISFRSPSVEELTFFENKCLSLNPQERDFISLIIEEATRTFEQPLHLPSVEQLSVTPTAEPHALQTIASYLELFFIYTKRNSILRPDSRLKSPLITPSLNTPSKNSLLDKILNYMEIYICDSLSINQLCNTFNISRSTLHQLFLVEKNSGVIEYFNKLKIKHSKSLIRDNKMNITEIAHYLSYSSLQHFSKQFKKYTGVSPSQYQKASHEITQAVRDIRPRKEN